VQILHAGDVVRARRRTWRVTGIRPYDGCRAVALVGAGSNAGATCELLSPFDQIESVARASTLPRRVGLARWRRAARTLIARSGVGAATFLRRSAHGPRGRSQLPRSTT